MYSFPILNQSIVSCLFLTVAYCPNLGITLWELLLSGQYDLFLFFFFQILHLPGNST